MDDCRHLFGNKYICLIINQIHASIYLLIPIFFRILNIRLLRDHTIKRKSSIWAEHAMDFFL